MERYHGKDIFIKVNRITEGAPTSNRGVAAPSPSFIIVQPHTRLTVFDMRLYVLPCICPGVVQGPYLVRRGGGDTSLLSLIYRVFFLCSDRKRKRYCLPRRGGGCSVHAAPDTKPSNAFLRAWLRAWLCAWSRGVCMVQGCVHGS
jgi:hypothetical protein